MPLENFGSILNFAEELEHQDAVIFEALAVNPACVDKRELFERFAVDSRKNMLTVQRTRRENVTEMILEPILDFTRAPYQEVFGPPSGMALDGALEVTRRLKERAVRYYGDAARKIKALPEVSRALAALARKHAGHLNHLDEQ
jgi:phosphoglycolate phosphatase-like HAD superfamily hydrolase